MRPEPRNLAVRGEASLVERNQRPLLADELVALALALETTPDVLYGPPSDVALVLYGEHRIGAVSVTLSLIGLELGDRLGTKTGERGGLLGGLVLIAVGIAIASGIR